MNNEKQEHIRKWKESGRTKADYCREHGIKYATFINWVKKETGSGGPAGWREIEISEERGESAGGFFVSLRIGEGWKTELIFRFGNDIP